MIKAIVAVDMNWAIGLEGKLLAYLPKDLQRFKEITKDNVVIMGRKTLESLPNGRPLKNRISIILTRDKNYFNNNVLIANSIEHLLQIIKDLSTDHLEKEFYVCGGGEIYKQLLPYTQEILVTKINLKSFDNDTFFPNLDISEGWKVISEEKGVEDEDYITDYITYERG